MSFQNMKSSQNNQSENLFKIGNNLFRLGILLLPSATFFSMIFLLIAFIIANIKRRNLFKDKWNFPLLICSFLMIIVCFISNSSKTNIYNLNLENNLNWLGTLNWIPMFWIFWSSQSYLKNIKERISCSYFLVLGLIPVLISGFGQYYFEWYGPIKLLNGTIIWYQRSSDNIVQALTGPFNNANYAGTWLAVIFPLCFFFIRKSTKFNLSKIFFSFLTIASLLATFLTLSRNAILNISIASVLLLGISFKLIFLFFLICFILLSSFYIFQIPLDYLGFLNENKIFSSFIPSTNKLSDIFNFTRIKIWKTAIMNIIKRPFIGWGASSFSAIYFITNGKPTFQHTHNIVFELAHNYGIIVSLILFSTILFLLYKTKPDFTKKNLSEDLINKCWWISSFIIIFMNLSDITYYDGRISILFWILLAGLRCLLRENEYKEFEINHITNK